MAMAEPLVVRTADRWRFRWVLIPVFAVVALTAWAYASPVGAAPDDDFHLASIWCAAGERAGLCADADNPVERVVSPAVAHVTCFVGDPERSAACQEPFFDEDPTPSVITDRGSFANNYPPVYYAVMNLFASPDLQTSALGMRVFNVLLFVGIGIGLALLLPRRYLVPLVGAWLVTIVPLGAFLLASNNPSSWALIGVGSSWLAMLGVYETTGKRRVGLGVLVVVAVLMAAGARGDAAIYATVGIAGAAFLAFQRGRRWVLTTILPALLAIGAILLFLSTQQAAVVSGGLGPGEDPSSGIHSDDVASGFGLFALNLLQVPSLWTGALGGWYLGWLDTPMPHLVGVGSFGVFAAVLFAGLRVHGWRKTLGVLGLAAILWLLPAYILTAGGNTVGVNVQPRYLLPLMVVLAGVALLPVRERAVRFGTLQLALAAGVLAAANSVALHMNLRRYVTGLDVGSANLDAGMEWWWPGLPLGPMAVWGVGTVAFGIVVAVVVLEYRSRRDHLV